MTDEAAPVRRTRTRRELLPVPVNQTYVDRKRAPAVEAVMKLMPEARETFEERQMRLGEKRIKYAGMIAHMEMAATVLAAGGTFRQAAAKAGVSVRQVKKYYTDADFRQRIEELRSTTFSKIRGRVLKELENRTAPEVIGNIELLDLLRIHDRVNGGVGGKPGVMVAGDINVTNNNYDHIINALLAPVAGEEGADFPIFEAEGIRLPGEDSPE